VHHNRCSKASISYSVRTYDTLRIYDHMIPVQTVQVRTPGTYCTALRARLKVYAPRTVLPSPESPRAWANSVVSSPSYEMHVEPRLGARSNRSHPSKNRQSTKTSQKMDDDVLKSDAVKFLSALLLSIDRSISTYSTGTNYRLSSFFISYPSRASMLQTSCFVFKRILSQSWIAIEFYSNNRSNQHQ
jgi:hypothetical protein